MMKSSSLHKSINSVGSTSSMNNESFNSKVSSSKDEKVIASVRKAVEQLELKQKQDMNALQSFVVDLIKNNQIVSNEQPQL